MRVPALEPGQRYELLLRVTDDGRAFVLNNGQVTRPTQQQSVSEGGYGTGLPVSVAELGAGEKMMDRALIHLYLLRGLVP